MERRWLALGPVESNGERTAVRSVRTLRWDEIARLVEVNPDGSWHPTEFARTRLIRRSEEEVLEV
jgi:hypothetical protein